ncbi:MAG TPA: hypothetical protein P5560_01685 [Thermotogota bacterium]|nr:hypothetical protein [Thermotogota bacterium]HRW91639.1 hypothetical protein [Thermotogota bacterium]
MRGQGNGRQTGGNTFLSILGGLLGFFVMVVGLLGVSLFFLLRVGVQWLEAQLQKPLSELLGFSIQPQLLWPTLFVLFFLGAVFLLIGCMVFGKKGRAPGSFSVSLVLYLGATALQFWALLRDGPDWIGKQFSSSVPAALQAPLRLGAWGFLLLSLLLVLFSGGMLFQKDRTPVERREEA